MKAVALAVLYVDLVRAVAATPEGRHIQADIAQKLRRAEERVHVKEQKIARIRRELERTGDGSLRATYEGEVADVDAEIAREEKALDEEQDQRLAPILESLREIVRAPREGARILDASIVIAPKPSAECDVTMWLVREYSARGAKQGKRNPLRIDDACRASAVYRVDLDRLMKRIAADSRSTERLNAYQRTMQSELDARQAELRRKEARLSAASSARERGEYERARIDLAARYDAWQKEMKAREDREEARLEDEAQSFVRRITEHISGLLFIDGSAAELEGLEMRCDATQALVELMTTHAMPADPSSLCPAAGGPAPAP